MNRAQFEQQAISSLKSYRWEELWKLVNPITPESVLDDTIKLPSLAIKAMLLAG